MATNAGNDEQVASGSLSANLFGSSNQQENIKVAVRLRPFTDKEKQRNNRRIVDIEKSTVVLYSPRYGDVNLKRFTFDYSYWSHDGFKRDSSGINVKDLSHPNCEKYVGQEKVFEDLGQFLLVNALRGYNSALLAYGQTGSGKSYTVSGYGQNEGILPRFARALFEELEKKAKVGDGSSGDTASDFSPIASESPLITESPPPSSATKGSNVAGAAANAPAANADSNSSTNGAPNERYEVFFSMIEIYNEVVRDLLAKNHGDIVGQTATFARRGLKVREHPKHGFFVENLTSFLCADKEEIERRIGEGQLNKSIAATSMNETSSRGHTIYEFKIKQFRFKNSSSGQPRGTKNETETVTTSVVQLVDLAGSERLAVHVTGRLGLDSFIGSRSSSPFPKTSLAAGASHARPLNSGAAAGPGGSGGSGQQQVPRASKIPTSATSLSTSAAQHSPSSSTVAAPVNTQKKGAGQGSGATITTAGPPPAPAPASPSQHQYNSQHQQRFKESVSINQSLSALGNSIQVLSQYSQQLEQQSSSTKQRPAPKIPYRDSVLTKLLNRCCLSGNSKVVIIATLSPADTNYDDTLSTLRFADRAKQIRTHATINRMSRGEMVDNLQKENERLKQIVDGRVTRSDDSSQTSNFDDSENIMENFTGSKIRNSSSSKSSKADGGGTSGRNIDATGTPIRSRTTVRKSREAPPIKAASSRSSKLASSSSNPSLFVKEQMKRLVSPAPTGLTAASSGEGAGGGGDDDDDEDYLIGGRTTLQKSQSVGYNLSPEVSSKQGSQDRGLLGSEAGDYDQEIGDEVSSGLVSNGDLGDIKEGLISPDSGEEEEEEDSFVALADEDLSTEEKIGIFNRLLSNSTQLQRDKRGSLNKSQRPRKANRASNRAKGMKQVSILSSSLKKTNPYLSNLNPDEQLTGMISYIIKQGVTIVGKDNECDIVLHGPELRGKHAKLTRTPTNDEEEGAGVAFVVTIEPIFDTMAQGEGNENQKKAENNVALMVNGSPVTKQTQLNHCDRLLFGTNAYFIYTDNINAASHTTGADLDLITFDMARNEVLRKVMAEEKHEAMIKEINDYTHRPGTGKHKVARAQDESAKQADQQQSGGSTSLSTTTTTTTTTATATTTTNKRPGSQRTIKEAKLIRSMTIHDREASTPSPATSPNAREGGSSLPSGGASINEREEEGGEVPRSGDGNQETMRPAIEEELNQEANYRDQLMDDTYEYALPVAEVNAVAKEMGIKVTYGLKILTGEEQLPDQMLGSVYADSVTSDLPSSSLLGGEGDAGAATTNQDPAAIKTQQSTTDRPAPEQDERVTTLNKLDCLDIPPALYIKVHFDEQDIDFYWSKNKFQARRYKILELYGPWDVGGKSGLVEHLIDQSKTQGHYLIDPFIDDPNTTFVLIGHAQITLQPISHLTDIKQNYDILDLNDETVGSIGIEAIPCSTTAAAADTETPSVSANTGGEENVADLPYRPLEDEDLNTNLLQSPQELLGRKLVFMLKILSCKDLPAKYCNVFCQYTLRPDSPSIKTRILREGDSFEDDAGRGCEDDGTGGGAGTDGGSSQIQAESNNTNKDQPNRSDELFFNHSHFISFEQVNQDMLDFLEHGFLTIQVVGQYRVSVSSAQHNKSPTVISTIINSINKYKFKMEQQNSYNGTNYSGSAYNSNTDSAKSNRQRGQSGAMNSNSGASSVVSTVNLFDQQNEDDEGNSMNGLSQENIIDMILTKRKLDRAENQLHYLKRTVNIAEHYNKKHIPVKTVKKLLNSYGHELDSGSLEEIATDVTVKGSRINNKHSACMIQ